MNIRLIHPVEGVVAEFASAQEMIAYFMRKGREGIQEVAEPTGLLFQVFQGGLIFQEVLDRPTGPRGISAQELFYMPANSQVH